MFDNTYKKNNDAMPARITREMAMMIFLANCLSPKMKAIAHLIAVLTMIAIMMAIAALANDNSFIEAMESVIASTSANPERKDTT